MPPGVAAICTEQRCMFLLTGWRMGFHRLPDLPSGAPGLPLHQSPPHRKLPRPAHAALLLPMNLLVFVQIIWSEISEKPNRWWDGSHTARFLQRTGALWVPGLISSSVNYPLYPTNPPSVVLSKTTSWNPKSWRSSLEWNPRGSAPPSSGSLEHSSHAWAVWARYRSPSLPTSGLDTAIWSGREGWQSQERRSFFEDGL